MHCKSLSRAVAISLLATIPLFPAPGNACTSIFLKASDGGVVYGRTMEMGFPLHSELVVVPRNFAFQGAGVDGKNGSGLNWTARYAAVGMNAVGVDLLTDGMNEKGLTGSMQNLPNSSKYQNPTPAESSQSLSSAQLLTYVLTNFATVDEVKAGLPQIKVIGVPIQSFGDQVPLQHFGIHDASGKSIVVEYLDGQLVITDNPTGAMANDPPFRDQLKNIGNYANLSKDEKPAVVINGTSFNPPSSGSGLHGLPGSYLSPDRFIRAVFLSNSVPASYTTAQMTNAAWHVLGSFDIPPGSITLPANNPYGGGVEGLEVSEWSVVAETKNMTYNVKMFGSMNVYQIDVSKVDVSAKEIKHFKLDKPPAPITLN